MNPYAAHKNKHLSSQILTFGLFLNLEARVFLVKTYFILRFTKN